MEAKKKKKTKSKQKQKQRNDFKAACVWRYLLEERTRRLVGTKTGYFATTDLTISPFTRQHMSLFVWFPFGSQRVFFLLSVPLFYVDFTSVCFLH